MVPNMQRRTAATDGKVGPRLVLQHGAADTTRFGGQGNRVGDRLPRRAPNGGEVEAKA